MNFSKDEIELLTKFNLTKTKWSSFMNVSIENHIDYSFNYCKSIALGHYENFPVASIILPKKLRKYIFSVYAFSRLADDIADECHFWESNTKIEKLDNLIELIKSNLSNQNNDFFHPILNSVIHTINEFNLNINLFERLINAFKYDSEFREFETFDDVINYCDNSANPIGELILGIFGEISKYQDNKQTINNTSIVYKSLIHSSNSLCTALQLVNFWQDFSRDKINNRFYVSNDILKQNNLTINEFYFENSINLVNLERVLNDIYTNTENYFENSKNIHKFIKNKRLKLELLFIYYSGYRIFQKVKSLNSDIINKRPKLSKKDYIKITFDVFITLIK